MVTSIKNQGQCGDCWAFASCAALESSLLIRQKTTDTNIDLSVQQVTDCAEPNGCQGGTSFVAYRYILSNGITSDKNWPFRGNDNRCPGQLQPVAHIRDYCIRGRFRYYWNMPTEFLTEETIKSSLFNFGPLYIVLNADSLSNYRGGIFVNPRCSKQPNHAVTLVGYTPNAWIIKNSWGSNWGEKGFFMLARGQNMCGINTEVAYPIV